MRGSRIYRKLFARPQFYRLNRALFQLSLRGLGVLNYSDDDASGERYLLRRLLPQLIVGSDAIILDVGANIGDYSCALHESFPTALIHTFEPHPLNFAQLERRLSSPVFEHHKVAVGDAPGKFTLYDRADFKGSPHATLHRSVISEIHRQADVGCEVEVIRLDTFFTQRGIEAIDFMKVDTEGNELAVLKGCERYIEQGRFKCIQFEFNEMNIMSKVFFRDFRKLLRGYELYRLLPKGLLPLDESPLMTEIFAFQNVIALRSDLSLKS